MIRKMSGPLHQYIEADPLATGRTVQNLTDCFCLSDLDLLLFAQSYELFVLLEETSRGQLSWTPETSPCLDSLRIGR